MFTEEQASTAISALVKKIHGEGLELETLTCILIGGGVSLGMQLGATEEYLTKLVKQTFEKLMELKAAKEKVITP